jgi:undecaprenyl-diphosphatase
LRLFSLLTAIRLSGLAIAIFALWGFVELADEVLEQETEAIDRAILLTVRQFHAPWLDRLMVGITHLGDFSVLTFACITCMGVLLYRKRRSKAVTLAIAAVGAGFLNFILKAGFGRDRPELWARTVEAGFSSFPSGHAMTSLVIYGAIAYLLVRSVKGWRRWLVVVLAALLIGAIGFSRLYLGVHWPTDVMAGYTAGLVWLIACIISLEVWQDYRNLKSL